MKKITSFLLLYPELEEQWCYEKNIGLNPLQLSSGSEKRAYWKCKKGHEWEAPILKRTSRGQGCPYCSNRRVCKDNALATVNPTLASQWNYCKNGELTPELVTAYTGKKVWWKCKEGHEWEATINTRNKGAGCHYCTKQKTLIEDSLYTLVPRLLKEWDYEQNRNINPKEVPPGSGKKVWWRCTEGHIWQDKIINRYKNETGSCPTCSSLGYKRPDLAAQWNINKNRESVYKISPGAHKTAWWKCEEGHEWKERIDFRTRKDEATCRVCESIFVKHPKLVEEWDNKQNKQDIKTLKPGSRSKVWWKCRYNHSWKATVAHRALRGQGCPKCNSQTSMPEQYLTYALSKHFQDTENRKKIDSIELDIYIPSLSVGIEYDGSRWHGNKLRADIEKDLYVASKGITLIRIREKGLFSLKTSKCFTISSHPNEDDLHNTYKKLLVYIHSLKNTSIQTLKPKKIDLVDVMEYITYIKKEKSLATTHPHLKSEWDYTKNGNLEPHHFTHGSKLEVYWVCEKGHSWKKVISKRSRGENCPYCSGRRADKVNNVLVQYPKVAKEWHPVKNGEIAPQSVTPVSSKKIWWQCKKGHEWEAAVGSRTANGTGCPYCSGKIASEENNLKLKVPELCKEWHPTKNGELTPQNVTSRSAKKIWWTCTQGHEWQATVYHRVIGKTGCPYCSGRKPTVERTLAAKHPNLIQEWHPIKNGNLTPEQVSFGSSKKVWWKCSKGHEWQAQVCNRNKGTKCPYCYEESRRKS